MLQIRLELFDLSKGLRPPGKTDFFMTRKMSEEIALCHSTERKKRNFLSQMFAIHPSSRAAVSL